MKKENSSKKRIRVLTYSILSIIILGGYCFIFQRFYENKALPRTYCGRDIRLAGMNSEEVGSLLKMLVGKIEKQGLSFSAETEKGDKKTSVKPQLIALTDPDLSRQLIRFDLAETMTRIFPEEKNSFRRIIGLISSLFKDHHVNLVFEINEEEIKQTLKNEFDGLQMPAQDARFSAKNKTLVLEGEQPGFILDYQGAINELKNGLKNFDNREIRLAVIQEEPGITVREIQQAFDRAQDVFNLAPYFLSYQGKQWTIPPAEVGKWLNFKKDQSGQTSLDLDQKQIIDFLQSIGEEINVAPVNQKLEVKDGKVAEFQMSQTGHVLNPVVNAELITREMLAGKQEIILRVDAVDPTPLPDSIDNLGIKELVGEGSSNFAGSPKNRRANIKLGAEKLHGLLIPPDREFSVIEAIGPVDDASGFLPELVIKGDRTVPEYGGGLCQIGTTMFRVAIDAGLPITERSPHSYRVVYYEPAGMDATIYNPHPDLRFINDTGHYLLLQTEVDGDNLKFRFYGTTDGRKVQTTTPVVSNIVLPGPVQYIETTELAPGEKKRIESSHAGADAEFKNIITFSNGIVREEVWKSHYRPWPEVWLVGKETEKETESAEVEPTATPGLEQEVPDGTIPHQ